jgi:diguanylate cyclase (GGDEF)-like protein/PAS domain S-box-containing protein
MDSKLVLSCFFALTGFLMIASGLYISNQHTLPAALLLLIGGSSLVPPYRHIKSTRKRNETFQTSSVEKIFQDTFDKAAIGLAHVDLKGQFIRVNKNLCDFLGYSESELITLTFQELSLAEDLEESLNWIKGSLAGNITADFSKIKRYRHKDGHLVWAKLTTTLVRNEISNPDYFASSIQDISELKETEDLLRQSETKFKTIVEAVSDEIVIWMSTARMQEMLYVNKGYEKLWGQSLKSLYDDPKSFLNSVHPDDIQQVLAAFEPGAGSDWNIDFRIIREDGEIRHIHNVGFGVYSDEQLLYLVGSAVDRTKIMSRQHELDDSLLKLKVAYQSLEELSKRDSLTNVLNRSAFMEKLEDAFQQYKRYRIPASLIFIDLDRFKEINDNYGHITGDDTLIYLATILTEKTRQTDSLGRYGGDEFVILLSNSTTQQAIELSQRVGSKINVPCENRTQPIQVGISFGIYELDDEIQSIQQWISHADSSMYEDKDS